MKTIRNLVLLASVAAAMFGLAAGASADYVTTTTNGTAKTPTIHLVNEHGHVTLANSIANIECSSTAEFAVTSHGAGKGVEGDFPTLTFTGCTNDWHVTVTKAGSLSISAVPTHSGIVISNGALISTTRFGVSCNYETTNTGIGVLFGGSPATLETVDATIPIAAGSSFLCGSGSATWEGAYLTTSALYVVNS